MDPGISETESPTKCIRDNGGVSAYFGLCPGVPVHEGFYNVFSLLVIYCFRVVYCLVFVSFFLLPVHEDRTLFSAQIWQISGSYIEQEVLLYSWSFFVNTTRASIG